MSKKTTTILIVIVLLAMILTGTFAWSQYNQHKTNEANGSGLKYDASLIENFKEIENWKVSAAAVTKEIRVKNSGLTGGSYGDVYVRLQLKEYMEMSEIIPVYSAYRYMIGTVGQFITYDDLAAWEASPYYGTHEADWTKTVEDSTYRYYVRTQAEDDNGQYGKFLQLSASSGDAIPLIEDTERATDVEDHDLATNGECAYPIHLWTATSTEPEDCERRFHEYIRWYLGDDVISMEEWDGDPVKKWIYDTGSAEGWVYWGAALAPGETTSNLLEAIKLIKQPDGNFYYAIHTDMEAVSFNELSSTGKWSGVPEDILTALAVPTVKAVSIEVEGATEGAEGLEAARGATLNFSSIVTRFNGATDAVDWSIKGNTSTRMAAFSVEDGTSTIDGSKISQAGVLEIAFGETARSLTITATSRQDSEKSDFITIILNGPLVTKVVASGAETIVAGTTETYSAQVTVQNGNDLSGKVRWEVSNGSDGTYIETATDGNAILHVAGNEEAGRILTVTAISTYDEKKSDSIKVTVGKAPVTDITATPAEVTMARGGIQTFTALLDSTFEVYEAVTWSLFGNDSDGTFIDPESGELTIADDESAKELTITAASVDGSKSTTATVKVGQVLKVTASPSEATMARGETQPFKALVSAINEAPETVTWSVNSDNPATKFLEGTNELHIAATETNAILTVTATSTYDGGRLGNATVKVGQITGITISPTNVTLQRTSGSNKQTFTPTVTPAGASTAIDWTITGASDTKTKFSGNELTIGSDETAMMLMVTATSSYDSSRSVSTTVSVGQVMGVTAENLTVSRVSNTSATVNMADKVRVSVVNEADPEVEWSLSGSDPSGSSEIDASTGVVTIAATETSATLTVTATSTYDRSKSATATVTVTTVTLPSALSGLTGTEADIGEIFTVDGYEWKVLTVDDRGNLLIHMTTRDGTSTFNATGDGNDYTGSNLDKTIRSTYNNADKLATLYQYMQPVELVTEASYSTSARDALSYVDTALGDDAKTAFALSVSEANVYYEELGRIDSANAGPWWLRTRGSSNTAAARVRDVGTIHGTNLIGNTNGVRPAMWINLTTTTVTGVTGVTINERDVTLPRSDDGSGSNTQAFTADVSVVNNVSTGVNWSVSGNSSTRTTITSGGILTVGSDESSQSLMVTATSTYDARKTASVTVKVGQITGLTVANQTVTRELGAAATATMSKTVTPVNDASQEVTWSLSGASSPGVSSTINENTGVVTIAHNEATTLTVTATSTYDDSKIGTGTVTVTVTMPANLTGTTADIGETFSAAGYTWRVLTVDGSGNMLITTTQLLASGTTRFNTSTADGNDYESSNLKDVIGTFYGSSGMDALRSYVQPVNLKTEAGSDWNNITENTVDDYSGLSIVDGSGDKRAFALSKSEALKYFNNTDIADRIAYDYTETAAARAYWLRTPYPGTSNAGLISALGVVTANIVNNNTYRVRPALWINVSTELGVEVAGVTIRPENVTLQRSEGSNEQSFVSTVKAVSGATTGVAWSVSGNSSAGTKIDESGLLTIGSDETALVITVTASYGGNKARAVVMVGQVLGVTVANRSVSRFSGAAATVEMEATVYGVNVASTGLEWSLSGSNPLGSSEINESTGEVTIGENETSKTLMVTATAVSDRSKSNTGTITIVEVDEVVVELDTKAVTLGRGGTQTFKAGVVVPKGEVQTVKWSVSGSNPIDSSTIDVNGKLTIGEEETATELIVTAVSDYETDKSATATITIPQVSNVGVDTTAVTLSRGDTKTFSPTVTWKDEVAGSPDGVTWSISSEDRGSSIDENGNLTIGVLETATTLVVTATSTYDTDKKAEARITVSNPIPAGMANLTGTKADIGEIFTVDNATWKVLEIDDDGNYLIHATTRDTTLGLVQFNTSTELGNSYIGSNLDTTIRSTYNNATKLLTLYQYMQKVDLKTESEWVTEWTEDGLSKVDTTLGEEAKTAFVLSNSEARKYYATGADRAGSEGLTYWLRSPYTSESIATVVYSTFGSITANSNLGVVTYSYRVRPALWINFDSIYVGEVEVVKETSTKVVDMASVMGSAITEGMTSWSIEGNSSAVTSIDASSGVLSIAPGEKLGGRIIVSVTNGGGIRATAVVEIGTEVGNVFQEDGYTWKTLAKSGDNYLIHATTRDTGLGAIQFRAATPYSSYTGSNLESKIRNTYNNATKLQTLYQYMQPVKLVTETTQGDYTVTDTGLSYVDTTLGETGKTAFALSISELNSYYADGAAATKYKADSLGPWWLRSPGSATGNSAAYVGTDGSIYATTVTSTVGVRPALWIKLTS